MIIDFNDFTLFNPNNEYKIMHLDLVDSSYKIIKSNRSNLILSGILDSESKIIYGFNHQKKPYKIFIPFNKNFSKFLVAYESNINKIVSIKYLSWNGEYPIGQIVQTYGSLDPRFDQIKLASIYSSSLVDYNGYKQIRKNKEKIDYKIIISEYHTEPKEFKFICNIDPPNCLDIDDVISYSDNIIGIHITDVIYILKALKYQPKLNIYTTIYPWNSKPYNILPDELIDKYLTLKPDNLRYVWSIYLHIDNNDIIKYELKTEKIINKISYSYEDADKIKELKYISKFTESYGLLNFPNIYNSYENHLTNSHYIINILMIIANKYIGKILLSESDTIYRLNGLYSINNNINKHDKMNIENYTHFTSPIRRYIDQYIQNLLYKKIYNIQLFDMNLKEFLSEINYTLNEMKIISNKYKILSLINNYHDAKLIDIELINNKLYLKWLINNQFKIKDIIKDPLLENNILINRINMNKISLELNKNYRLKIEFLIIRKFPKLFIHYY
jgi:hypothetical protein